MVMGKVSKAIAASFLCLLFNGSGTTTNAMQELEIAENNINDINNSTKKVLNVRMELEQEQEQEQEQEKKDDGDNSDGKNNKKTNILHIIIPVAVGVCGFGLGAILGKFVF